MCARALARSCQRDPVRIHGNGDGGDGEETLEVVRVSSLPPFITRLAQGVNNVPVVDN